MISDLVRGLIADHLTSIEQLEILLLFRRDPERTWTAEQVNQEIRSDLASVTARLADLEARGFLARDSEAHRYVAQGSLDRAVVELAATYAERRFAVMDLVFAKPSDKVRVFADAFRIRRGKEDG